MTKFTLSAALLSLFVAACGGGGDASAPIAVPSPTPNPAPAPAPVPTPTQASLVVAPVTKPPLAADGRVLWPVPVDVSDVVLQIRLFATLPPASDGAPPRLNVLAHTLGRMFVADEIDGRIYEITNGQVRLWFDAGLAMVQSTGRSLSVSRFNAHTGFRSIAFHPSFATNGKFYTSVMEQRPASPAGHVYLSDVPNPVEADSVLIEWTANPATMVVQPTSYREVFRVGIPVYDHPIKQILFRPGARAADADFGLLYVGHGDGSLQSVTVGGGMANDARGKILRINPLQAGSRPYSVPVANPFVASASMIPEAYSIGHRNPHHLAFAADGTLIVAEAGRDNIDEVNVVEAGANHGWPAREGSLVHLSQGTLWNGVDALPTLDASLNYTYPAMQFLHQGTLGTSFTGQSLGGGYVVENGSPLSGRYFATDFVFTGDVFVTLLASLKAAITRGAPSDLRMAPIATSGIAFDLDNDPATAAIAFPNLAGVSGLAAAYDQSGRVDMRFGQGPNGEMYLLSKRNRNVYLVSNSVR